MNEYTFKFDETKNPIKQYRKALKTIIRYYENELAKCNNIMLDMNDYRMCALGRYSKAIDKGANSNRTVETFVDLFGFTSSLTRTSLSDFGWADPKYWALRPFTNTIGCYISAEQWIAYAKESRKKLKWLME